jgi:hypothetical protein
VDTFGYFASRRRRAGREKTGIMRYSIPAFTGICDTYIKANIASALQSVNIKILKEYNYFQIGEILRDIGDIYSS